MRKSTIPIRTIKVPNMKPVCVGCHSELGTELVYTGSIAVGRGFGTVHTIELVSLNPVQYGETSKRVSWIDRKKGPICARCASNYRSFTWTDSKGNVHSEPLVKTDPQQRFLGQTLPGERATKAPKFRPLNTTITR